MDHSPLVSVIMPAYNSARYIGSSIQSVRDQKYENWELFVIDDASVDQTRSEVENFIRIDPRIKLIQNPGNQGAGAARNKGIEKAKGLYIAFLDADDLWMPEKLEIQVKFMRKYDLAMSFSSYRLITESGGILPQVIEALPILKYSKLLKSNYVGNLTGMYSTEILGKIYSPLFRKRQDWALWLDVLKKGKTARGIQRPLAYYRIRKNSVSYNKFGLVKYNFLIYRRFLSFGLLKSSSYMCIFLWEHFVVRTNPRR